MVKVLSRGGQNLGAVARHIDYLTRKGELDIETDDGQQLKGQGTEAVLLDDWDLVLDEERSTVDLKPRAVRNAPKLVRISRKEGQRFTACRSMVSQHVGPVHVMQDGCEFL